MDKKTPEKAIEDLKGFINATHNEFFSMHPEIYRQVCHHLGSRIFNVKNGELDEKEYIGKWGRHKYDA